MVTPRQMRQFAAECLRWAEKAENASQRDLMVRVARGWLATAAALERSTEAGDLVLPDLRPKLD